MKVFVVFEKPLLDEFGVKVQDPKFIAIHAFEDSAVSVVEALNILKPHVTQGHFFTQEDVFTGVHPKFRNTESESIRP